MKNRRAPKPTLPRPKKCLKCGAAVQWQTARIGGRVVDSYRCLNGHSSEDGEIGVQGWVERKS